MKEIVSKDGRWWCWGSSLAHNSLSCLTRREYRCGCRWLTADGGWLKIESQCETHKGEQDPPLHKWINRF